MTDAEPSTKYGHLASVLRDEIRRGRYVVGAELPSISAIANEAGVSHMTVKQALRRLADEGVIETQRGTRARVTSVPNASQAPIATQLQDIHARLSDLETRTQALERQASKRSSGPARMPPHRS